MYKTCLIIMAGFSLSNVFAMQDEQVNAQDLLAQAYVHEQIGHQLAEKAEEESFTTFEDSLYQKAKDHYSAAHTQLLLAFQAGNQSARCLIKQNYQNNISVIQGKKYTLKKSCSIGKDITAVCDVIRENEVKKDYELVTWQQVLKETYLSPETIEKAKENISILSQTRRKLTSSLKKLTG